MPEMYIAGYRNNSVPDRSACVMIGEYRLQRLPKLAGLEDRFPQLYELSGPDGGVYAVETDKDLLIAFVHCAHPRLIGAQFRTPIPSATGTHTLLHIQTVDLEHRPLFDYYEVWDQDALWARFPTEQMAQQALIATTIKAA